MKSIGVMLLSGFLILALGCINGEKTGEGAQEMKSNGSVLEDYGDHRDPPEPDAMFNLSGRGNHTLKEGLIPPPNGTPSFMPGGGEMDMNLSELRKRPNLSDNARREGVHEAMHDKQGGMPPR